MKQQGTIVFMLMIIIIMMILQNFGLAKRFDDLENNISISSLSQIEYGLILNKDYTITIIDMESDEIVGVSTIDSLGYRINDLQQ